MGLIDNAINALRFKDTIFLKENTDLNDKYNALARLNKEYPENKELLNELFIVKKGFDGENEIEYQLKKANIGMYVLRDIHLKHDDLTAQVDYIVITPIYIYYIECKNLVGNITINDHGDFIREYTIDGKTIKKGMYSPLRQVEAQRDVIRKIWDNSANPLTKFFAGNKFNYYRRVLVVAANHDTILKMKYAPRDIKDKVLRSDSLIKRLEQDLMYKDSSDYLWSKNKMEEIANSYLELNVDEKIDWYDYYKKKYIVNKKEVVNKEELKEKLIKLRQKRSAMKNMPPYYVFNNEELDKIIETMPKTMKDLESILPDIKVRVHGSSILEEINGKNE